jgi:hypothetical protein
MRKTTRVAELYKESHNIQGNINLEWVKGENEKRSNMTVEVDDLWVENHMALFAVCACSEMQFACLLFPDCISKHAYDRKSCHLQGILKQSRMPP